MSTKGRIVGILILSGMYAQPANAQNVGISEENPLQRLDVAGGIRIGNTSNALAGSIRWTGTDFEAHDGVSWKSLVTTTVPETDPTWSGAANLTAAIGRTGNVGIGTTSPGAKLEVDGSVRITGGASDVFNDAGQLALKRSSSDAPIMSFHAANGTRQAFIQSTGTHFNIRNQQQGGIVRIYTEDTEQFRVGANGTVRAFQLAGTDTRPVYATSNGTLTTPPANVGFHVRKSSNQSHGRNAWVKQQWQSSVFNHGGGFDMANNRFTVPAGQGGVYLFTAGVHSNELGGRDQRPRAIISLWVNGSERTRLQDLGLDFMQWRFVSVSGSAVLNLSAGDHVEVFTYWGYNADHTEATILWRSGVAGCYFTGARLY